MQSLATLAFFALITDEYCQQHFWRQLASSLFRKLTEVKRRKRNIFKLRRFEVTAGYTFEVEFFIVGRFVYFNTMCVLIPSHSYIHPLSIFFLPLMTDLAIWTFFWRKEFYSFLGFVSVVHCSIFIVFSAKALGFQAKWKKWTPCHFKTSFNIGVWPECDLHMFVRYTADRANNRLTGRRLTLCNIALYFLYHGALYGAR